MFKSHLAVFVLFLSCTGYQPVPTVGVGYDPQTGHRFWSMGVTYAAPLNLSAAATETLRPLPSKPESAELARLRAENTALKAAAARAAEHDKHQEDDSVGGLVTKAGEVDWTWPGVGAILAIAVLVWVWRRRPRHKGEAKQ